MDLRQQRVQSLLVLEARAGELRLPVGQGVDDVRRRPNLLAGRRVAFQVTGVDTSGTDWPAVTVQVLDTRETCGEGLAVVSDAPSN